MCNYDYLKQEIENNDLLFVDSCSTMEHEGFESFINNVRELLLSNNKKIKIISEVYCELIKHSCSKNIYKQEAALNALNIIKSNCDLFEIECEEDINKEDTFADPKLLAHLLNNIASQKQLLITNDKKLSSDAYNFNSLNSINGRRIHVCYINKNGDMKKCDCTNASNENQKEMIIDESASKHRTITYEPSIFDRVILPGIVGIATAVAYENRKKIHGYISAVACSFVKIFA